MIITTSSKPDDVMIRRAQHLADEYQLIYTKRDKKTIQFFHKTNERVYMVGKEGKDVLCSLNNDSFFFHPSMAKIRLLRLEKGENDPLVDASMLQAGDAFLDLTLGLGSDSIIASSVVGSKGKVVGIEKQPFVAEVVKTGLLNWHEAQLPNLNEAMRRVQVVICDHLDYLQSLSDQSFDVVYLDPMFKRTIAESIHLQPLKQVASYDALQSETISEAIRVARKTVVLKAESTSTLFATHAFERMKRRPSSVSYGTILAAKKEGAH